MTFLIKQEGTQKKINWDEVRERKVQSLLKFKAAYDKAVKEGTITYKKI